MYFVSGLHSSSQLYIPKFVTKLRVQIGVLDLD